MIGNCYLVPTYIIVNLSLTELLLWRILSLRSIQKNPLMSPAVTKPTLVGLAKIRRRVSEKVGYRGLLDRTKYTTVSVPSSELGPLTSRQLLSWLLMFLL